MPKLDIITDPVTKKQFARDLSVAGSTYQPYNSPATGGVSVSPSVSSAPSASSYQIKAGDTLSSIAAANNTTVSDLMKANNLTNPNLIIAGNNLSIPGATSGVPDYSQVSSISEANSAINANQKADAASVTATGEPPTRKTVSDVMADITKTVTPTTAKPTADLTQTYQTYRTQYGVSDLETQLNDLHAQQKELLATQQARTTAEKGKPVAMNVIAGRIGQEEAQTNERLTAINNSISTVTDQLNTKYKTIDTLMSLEEKDYDNAVASYDKQMATNISMFNAAKSITDEEKTAEESAKDDARSNAQIVLNAYTAKGMTYDQLSSPEKTNLTKLGVQSGLGADFFQNVLKVSSGKDILTTITSADDSKASIIYKDGTVKTISTGLPVKPVSGTKATESETKTYYKQSMQSQLSQVVGSDGYVSPENWAKARRTWTANTAYTSADFDDAFRGYVNPNHPQDYAGFENYKAGFIKQSATELQAGVQ